MKRVLLKLSGEALAGEKKTGFDEATCIGVAKQVKQLVDDGVQVAIVTGGGNFWRGRTSETIDRVKADQIGMLATVMNCCKHTNLISLIPVDSLTGASSPEITSADHDADFQSFLSNCPDLLCNFNNSRLVKSGLLLTGKGFTA